MELQTHEVADGNRDVASGLQISEPGHNDGAARRNGRNDPTGIDRDDGRLRRGPLQRHFHGFSPRALRDRLKWKLRSGGAHQRDDRCRHVDPLDVDDFDRHLRLELLKPRHGHGLARRYRGQAPGTVDRSDVRLGRGPGDGAFLDLQALLVEYARREALHVIDSVDFGLFRGDVDRRRLAAAAGRGQRQRDREPDPNQAHGDLRLLFESRRG